MTELGWTAVRALSTLPPFNKDRPEVSEKAKKELFEEFISAASGDEVAYAEMKSRVAIYEAAVTVAEKLLLEKKTKPCKGVALVDSVGAGKADLNTLVRGMETEEIVVTVVRKDFGPIAGNPGKHGVQYSLAVKREQQDKLDLRELLPENMEKSPQAGILSNVPFLLHCSEQIWHDVILPALKSRLD